MKYELLIKRDLDFLSQISSMSLFLFGPRATGKTSLIKEELKSKAFLIDLLKSKFYLPLSQNPYLKDEILAEAAVRNLPAFSRFLKVASLCSGEILNYSNIASDVGLSANTIREYFSILDDTLLGFQLPAWQNANSRKSASKAKHYFFDCGVLNTLSGTKAIDRNSNLYGKCFEHFILQEIRAYNEYHRKRSNLSYWRTDTGIEVDLIIENSIAIEIKSTVKTTPKILKGIKAIQSEGKFTSNFLISQDEVAKQTLEGMYQIHWIEFLEKLWSGELDSLIR